MSEEFEKIKMIAKTEEKMAKAWEATYGSEYDRTMAMPSRGLTPEQVMANTPLSMMGSPLDKALVGDQDKLPQELQDAIENS